MITINLFNSLLDEMWSSKWKGNKLYLFKIKLIKKNIHLASQRHRPTGTGHNDAQKINQYFPNSSPFTIGSSGTNEVKLLVQGYNMLSQPIPKLITSRSWVSCSHHFPNSRVPISKLANSPNNAISHNREKMSRDWTVDPYLCISFAGALLHLLWLT